MDRFTLAERLVAAGEAERAALLAEHPQLADVQLAYALKDICLDGWSGMNERALSAAAALLQLSQANTNREITALSGWAQGIEALIHGQMVDAIAHLDNAAEQFEALQKPHQAAATQVSKLIAQATLGRYDEAIAFGIRARRILLAHHDLLAAGKIEHNLGNILFRRGRYHEAEQFQTAARERFAKLDDLTQLATINNCLANTHALLHKFKSAEELYEQAMRQAEAANLPAILAGTEGNIGNLALLQGRYDRALDYLERSRRRYAALSMPHQCASAEQEIADAYLELNLAPEAAEIYERITQTFAELGLRAEEARARLCHGRAAMMLGRNARARSWLARARELYALEDNPVGVAMVQLTEAQLLYKEDQYIQASHEALTAQTAFTAAGAKRRALVAQWLTGESTRAAGQKTEAAVILRASLNAAEATDHPDLLAQCHTSLGLLARDAGDTQSAELCFKQAIAQIEALRAPLPAEEFRVAFFADKLVPYHSMVELCLADGDQRVPEALAYVEQARARALADAVGGSVPIKIAPLDEFETALCTELEDLRQELNYLYHELNQPLADDAKTLAVREAVRERESQSLNISRQLRHRGVQPVGETESLDLPQLQSELGPDTALITYTSLADELIAFVVTNESIDVKRQLANEATVAIELSRLRFQIDGLRYGAASVRRHLPDLTRRTRQHLEQLYDCLLRPLENLIGKRRLVIVPHRALNYLPFQALYDGSRYLIETREISYAPSALVLHKCLALSCRPIHKALLLGVADSQTPFVEQEIESLRSLFPATSVLLNDAATSTALQREAPTADVIHLACHGHFRPDNPLFSSLKLGDGWLTVRDAYNLSMPASMVTLSACETGMNDVAPGEELIGLARGFFAAGAASLLISLWTVDDEATAEMMVAFYESLKLSGSPAQAVRVAQLAALAKREHPFFWAPFVLTGRW